MLKCFSEGVTACVIILVCIVAGCSSTQALPEPDEQFGHRYEDPAPDGTRVIEVMPPEEGQRFQYFSATFESVIVRSSTFDLETPQDAQKVQVEALIKGALPDGCMQLHSFSQERTGNVITATLQMRRPRGAVCTSAERPYRFYVVLDGDYEEGSYTLRLNGKAIPFQVNRPRS